MSKYSEVIGSFIRRGNYPLEADYIFANEAELKEFYLDPLLQAILHKGLLKIVENDGTGVQALYWVTKKQTNNELEFTKLVSGDISLLIDSLLDKISKEIEDRKKADMALWGTTDNTTIPDLYNSIKDLYLALLEVQKDLVNNSEAISDLRDDVIEIVGSGQNVTDYLSTLTYGNLTKINKALEGVISGDYIKISADNGNDIVDLKTTMTPEGVLISGKLNLSPDPTNQLLKTSEGLFYNISSSYEGGILTIKANNNVISQHNIGITNLIESAKYDPALEALVIKFKLLDGNYQEILIPLTNLIREWEVDNSGATNVVELTREEVYSGGADKLSADVRLSDNKYNILERDGNRLLVKGTSENIRHEDVLMSVIINLMYDTFKSMTAEIQDLKDRIILLEAGGGTGGGSGSGGGTVTIPISISSFTANGTSDALEFAFGQVVDIVLAWTYNVSEVSSLTINGASYEVSLRTQTFNNVSNDITYTLVANHSNGSTATKSITVKFLPVTYSGAAYDEAGNLILSEGKTVESIELSNAQINTSGDYYTYIVPTASIGNGLVFSTPGFTPANEITNYEISTVDVQVGTSTINYTVYKLDNKYNGTFNLNVKQS